MEITLPLLYNEEFKLYKVLAVPTFNNGNFTCIVPSSDYLLVNLQRNHYYPINKDEFSRCKERPFETYWCTLQHPLYTSGYSDSSCEMKIIQNDRQQIDSCLVKDIPLKTYWIEMHQQNTWIYSVPNSTSANINCDFDSVPTILRGCGIMQLPSNCLIHGQTTTIIGRQMMTSRLKSSVLPSFNLSEQLSSLIFKTEQQQPILQQSNISLEISSRQ
ncbi:uncharacterized protein LOC129945069 [Eupeodes corollae]|uniref:uncharacterized protein LOC129945069 n=1 Tax=Eupeodes corollae TaxID=290404 RepID=UPI002492D5A9|nr:uncharacterized protein LOC129945069 [Eupeodes corollae]